jgi:hypothetical protein
VDLQLRRLRLDADIVQRWSASDAAACSVPRSTGRTLAWLEAAIEAHDYSEHVESA